MESWCYHGGSSGVGHQKCQGQVRLGGPVALVTHLIPQGQSTTEGGSEVEIKNGKMQANNSKKKLHITLLSIITYSYICIV